MTAKAAKGKASAMADGSASHGYNQPDHQGREPPAGRTSEHIGNGPGQRLRRFWNQKQGGSFH
jgi:hypothetical protein